MNTIFLPASQWPVINDFDVVVAGAGPAGIGAACAAAELGESTVIVEQTGYPGGVASGACCPYLMGFAAEGRQIVGGVAHDLVRELDAMGQAAFMTRPGGTPDPLPIGDRPLLECVLTSVEGMRIGANRLLERAGVHRMYYSTLVGATASEGRVDAIAVDRIDGPGLIRGKCFVDATGDANLVYRAGGQVCEHTESNPMTKTILIRVGGVPHFHRARVEERFYQLVEAGRVPFPEQDRFMGFALLNPGEALLNFTLIEGDAVRADELTRMDIALREQILVTVDWFRRYIPEFANCYLVDAATRVGVRSGRGIVGLETITQADVDADTPVDEPIALGTRGYGGHQLTSFTSDWSKSQPGIRGIPWKALLSASFANVAAGGRGISCDGRTLDTFRLMARCIATGQAAGVTAALAAGRGCAMVDVEYAAIRGTLLDQGAILE